MVKPKFYCSCGVEPSTEEDVYIHLEENQDHLIRIKYTWVTEEI